MLVISRFISETIHIGKAGDVLTGPIVVTALGVRRQSSNLHLRLGIDAQRDIGVFRSEMLDAVEMGQTQKEQVQPTGMTKTGTTPDELQAAAGL